MIIDTLNWKKFKNRYIKLYKKNKNDFVIKLLVELKFKDPLKYIHFHKKILFLIKNTLIENKQISNIFKPILINLIHEIILNNNEEYKFIQEFKKSNPVIHYCNDGNIMFGSINNIEYSTSINGKLGDSFNIVESFRSYSTTCIMFNNEIYICIDKSINNFDIINSQKISNFINDEQIIISKLHNINNFNNIKLLNGKDWVKYYMFDNSNQEGIIYSVKMRYKNQIFYKIGITKNDITKRYSMLKDIEILDESYIKNNMLVCSIIERYIHNSNKEYRIIFNTKIFDGYNECYYNDIFSNIDMNTILHKALDNLDETNYPINKSIMIDILKNKGVII